MRATAARVQQVLGLDHSIGQIQLLCVDSHILPADAGGRASSQAAAAAAASDGMTAADDRGGVQGRTASAHQAWLPLCVHFGLPLANVPMCEAVCSQV